MGNIPPFLTTVLYCITAIVICVIFAGVVKAVV
jgi:hypothetical protein